MSSKAAIFREYTSNEGLRSDRSATDRRRHRERVRASIKDNITDILSDESIIGISGDKKIKVPIRGIKEYRFVYGENKGVAQGDGATQEGQSVGKNQGDGHDGHNHGEAGDSPGEEMYETEFTIDELVDIMFEDLMLPQSEQKKLREIEANRQAKPHGYRRKGIEVRLDKRKTARSRIKRMKSSQRSVPSVLANNSDKVDIQEKLESDTPVAKQRIREMLTTKRFRFRTEDKYFKHFDIKPKKQSNAVIIMVMDTSGSIDDTQKYLSRSFFYLMTRFVRRQYQKSEMVFIRHDSEANECTEQEFFTKVTGGGTVISSAYKKALEIITERYDPSVWNVYTFSISDGDNLGSDNDKAINLLGELIKKCELTGYIELGGGYYNTGVLFKSLVESKYGVIPGFRTCGLADKSDVYVAFKKIIAGEKNSTGNIF